MSNKVLAILAGGVLALGAARLQHRGQCECEYQRKRRCDHHHR